MVKDDDAHRIPPQVARRLAWPLRLTRLGMAAERAVRLFWPAWSLLFVLVTGYAFGLQDSLPVELLWSGTVLGVLGLALLLLRGGLRFRWPAAAEAADRLDLSLPGRPIAALGDAQALGGVDEGSRALWQAHRDRMAGRAAAARPVEPDLRLAARDPFALRYVAVTALAMALLFGSLWRGGEIAAVMAGGGQGTAVAANGPGWEGWIEPPAYTGRPTLYLNKIEDAAIEIPEGSRITLRFYGATRPDVRETVSDPAAPVQAAAPAAQQARDILAARSGRLEIGGADGRQWALKVLPDAAPTISAKAEIGRKADGRMSLPFTATDDYAVTGGTATVTLDMAALDRRHGLAPAPEPRAALVYDLPLPITGKRDSFTETLAENASEHPWANLPVVIELKASDGRGQEGRSQPLHLLLPGRRFFDPVAAAVIEMRRDLLWTRDNGARVSQILRAVTNRPAGLVRNERAYLMLRVAVDRLDASLTAGFDAKARDEIAAALWEIAVLIEDGGLSDALARMQQAQERLSEAMRNGASPDEIRKLMDDLKQATDDYIRKLAENMENTTDEPDRQAQSQGQKLTGDQIQQMMDQIQKLMEQGRMAEAQELLDQLSRMMENLRVTQGQGGDGYPMPGGKGQQSMRDLQDTLRGQQGLSDETFRQGQQGQGQQGQGQPQQGGDNPGDGQGSQALPGQQPGEPGDGRSLAERQGALRRELDRQRQALPGQGTEEGDAARRSLDQAGRAMDEAERALRDGDTPEAIDRQAEAIDQMRRGMQSLGRALAQNQTPDGQSGGQQTAQGDADRLLPRDPLGRAPGQTGRFGSEENMLQGEDVYRRARDLLDEIRRRTGDRTRPRVELDYLNRLLDRF